jgi:hypothetical protein
MVMVMVMGDGDGGSGWQHPLQFCHPAASSKASESGIQ